MQEFQKKTVFKYKKRFRKDGNVNVHNSTGRPTKLNREQTERVVALAEENKSSSDAQIVSIIERFDSLISKRRLSV